MQGNLQNENYNLGHNKLSQKFQNSWGIKSFIRLELITIKNK